MTRRWRVEWLRIGLLGTVKFVLALAVFGAAELFSYQVLDTGNRMPLWLVLVATAVVTMVFWLLRQPLTRLVDTVLLGERAGGYEAGRELLQRMSTTLPVDDIVPALAETAGRTMHSTRAEVRLLLADGDPWSQVWPPRATADGSPVTVGVRHAGTAVGEIEVDVADADGSSRDRMLLDDLARPAGLALSTVRLTVELRRRAVELEALTAALGLSYQRITDARRTETERTRTELQESVMPHLDRAQAAITGADRADRARIDQARTEVAAALESLRTLARGIYPPRLADAGLAVSLEGWWQRSGIAVDVQIRGDQEVLHAYSELESCLYFCLVTALGALVANGERPIAEVEIGPAEVTVQITGRTRSQSVADGPTMMAVRDRVDAFGGRFEIAIRGISPEGIGPEGIGPETLGATTATRAILRAWIPLAGPVTGPISDERTGRS